MSKPNLDGRHRNKDGEISGKHGNTLVRTLRKIYGQGFAAGYPETATLSEVLLQLNETSLSQLRRESTWSTRSLMYRNKYGGLSNGD
jgi:hypothetical protein